MYVGSHLQEMSFIVDTGSPWTWMPNSDCPDNECTKGHYNYALSSGFTNSRVEEHSYYAAG